MSYIELSTPVPDVKRATISLWFRIPGSTIAAATQAYTDYQNGPQVPRPPLVGIIPLVVFGSQPVKQKGVKNGQRTLGEGLTITYLEAAYPFDDTFRLALIPSVNPQFSPAEPTTYPQFDPSKDVVLDPAHIGIDCTGDTPMLSVNLVMASDDYPTSSYITTAIGAGTFPTALNSYSNYSAGQYFPAIGGGEVFCDSYPPIDSYTADTNFDDTDMFWVKARPQQFRTLPVINDLTIPHGVEEGFDPFGIPIPIVQTSSLYSADFFGINPTGPKLQISPDHWHHLLLSFDLTKPCTTESGFYTVTESGSCTSGGAPSSYSQTGDDDGSPEAIARRTSSAAQMWLALDDVKLTGPDMSAYAPVGYSDPQGILTPVAYATGAMVVAASFAQAFDCNGGHSVQTNINSQQANYTYAPMTGVPFSDGEFGLPATAAYVQSVHHVEMGEMQVFLNTAMDTGSETNRRAFITEKGKPAPIGVAKKLFARDADVLLHGAGNWKKGRNTGALAEIPLTDGTHVGKIPTYRPNPNLYDNQGDPQ